ncbi:MAG: O-antigen ligase family protein [bacterium]
MSQEKTIHGSFQLLFLLAFLILLLSTSFFMSQLKPALAVGIAVGMAIFLISFLDINVALYLLILSMLLSPEFGQRTVYGRGMTLRIEDFLIAIVGFAWLAKNAYYKNLDELGLLRKTPINPYIFGYMVVCTFTTAIGMIAGRVNVKTGFFFVLKYFEYIIVYFILVNHLHDKKKIRDYTWLILLTCLIVCIIAIMQIPRGMRVTAPFEGVHGEPNTLGGYLVLMLSITIGIFFAMDSIDMKAILGSFSIIITIVLLYTLSRNSWLAALGMAMFFILFLKGKQRMFALLITSAAVLILILYAPGRVRERVSDTFVHQRTSWRQESILGQNLDQSTSARISDWKKGLRDWLQNHFIFGYGVTGYSFMDAQFIRIAVETGIIGLIAFILLLKAIFKNAWHSYRKVHSPFFKGLSLGYLAGFVGLLVHCIGTNTFIIVRIMEPFWFLTGMVIMLPELEKKSEMESMQGINTAGQAESLQNT